MYKVYIKIYVGLETGNILTSGNYFKYSDSFGSLVKCFWENFHWFHILFFTSWFSRLLDHYQGYSTCRLCSYPGFLCIWISSGYFCLKFLSNMKILMPGYIAIGITCTLNRAINLHSIPIAAVHHISCTNKILHVFAFTFWYTL